ncbi:hypothetical protein F5X98DRAFT_157737 [Xylaria grammica]|nr:hypothetical protein F5X98DRAFT_157737 [Xylaria grammica]
MLSFYSFLAVSSTPRGTTAGTSQKPFDCHASSLQGFLELPTIHCVYAVGLRRSSMHVCIHPPSSTCAECKQLRNVGHIKNNGNLVALNPSPIADYIRIFGKFSFAWAVFTPKFARARLRFLSPCCQLDGLTSIGIWPAVAYLGPPLWNVYGTN